MRFRLAIELGVMVTALASLTAGSASAADECSGLRVCVPVTGPWVVVPPGGVEYEFNCPLYGYIVAGTDARLVARDVDVSFRGETGSPVRPGVTTQKGVVFSARRTRAGAGATSFEPFIGCVPSNGGGGRALTGEKVRAVSRPTRPLTSVVVTEQLGLGSSVARASCPQGSRFLTATHAVAFRQTEPPRARQLGAVRARVTVAHGVALARVTVAPAAGLTAELQLRVLCARRL